MAEATLRAPLPDAAAATMDAGLAFLCYLRSELRAQKPGGLSMPQFRFLHMLAKDEARTLGDLADDLGVSPPAMTKMADGLVERGLLERAVDPSDRRRATLALTPAGTRLVAGFRRNLERGLAERLSSIPARKQAELAFALRDLQSVLAPQVTA